MTPHRDLHGIYALVEPQCHADPLAYVDALLRGGIRLFQLRAKQGADAAFLDAFVARVRAAGGVTIVNDDVALAERSDGVHLGQKDAAQHDLDAVRRRLGGRIIGLSCGTPQEARAAHAAVDYVGAGPIFATASKPDAGGPIGASGVRAVVEATALPVAAIGGIALARLGVVRETGAAMAAVISALAGADDPETAARAFVRAWNA
jgi:thiamine-phosphate pyrophosphorylase